MPQRIRGSGRRCNSPVCEGCLGDLTHAGRAGSALREAGTGGGVEAIRVRPPRAPEPGDVLRRERRFARNRHPAWRLQPGRPRRPRPVAASRTRPLTRVRTRRRLRRPRPGTTSPAQPRSGPPPAMTPAGDSECKPAHASARTHTHTPSPCPAQRGVAGCGSSLTLTAEIMAVSPTPRGSQSVLLSLTDTVRRPAPRLGGTGRS